MVLMRKIVVGWSRSCRKQLHTQSGRRQAGQQLVVEQKKSQDQHKIIQERVIGGEDDADLKWRKNQEADDLPASRKKEHEHQHEFSE